jgi:hypothetical protein
VQAPIEVRNRPPVVRAHDGSPVPHAFVGTRYLLARSNGSVVTWEDPDGDPPAPGSVSWSSPSPKVEFEDATDLATMVQVLGTREEISDVELVLEAADINGAEAADRAVLPVGNNPPTVTYGGDSRPGHSFVRTESDGTHVYRKEISLASLQSQDPDGDPLLVQVVLDPLDPAAVGRALRIVEDAGRFFLEGEGPSFIGETYRVIAEVIDPWGGGASTIGSVLVSNRPPIVLSGPQATNQVRTARLCQPQSCCVPGLGGESCATTLSASMATYWNGTSGALVMGGEVVISDPDGDPLSLVASFANVIDARPKFRSGNQWVTGGALPCTQQGASWSCPVQVRIDGVVEAGAVSCEVPTATRLGATVGIGARASDGLGGYSAEKYWAYTTGDDPTDGSCP